jgi:hypothetical protein
MLRNLKRQAAPLVVTGMMTPVGPIVESVVSVLIFTSPGTELPAVFSGSWGVEVEEAANGQAAFVCRRCGGNLKISSSQIPTVGIGIDIRLIPGRLK